MSSRLWFLRRIALRHVRMHRLRILLTAAGVAVGASTLVATAAVGRSSQDALDRLARGLGGDADFHISGGSVGIPEEIATDLLDVPGLAAIAPLVQGVATSLADPAVTFDVFGVDVLGDRPWAESVRRTSVRIRDETAFVVESDAVLVSARFAAERGLREGSTLEVVLPAGPRTLVVRGTIDSEELDGLLAGRFLIMDMHAAQAVLRRETRYDRIDLRLLEGADAGRARSAVETALAGRARVDDPAAFGRRSMDVLATLGVMLDFASALALMVGFFIVYHTVSVSLAERRETLVLLQRLGVTRGALRLGLLGEAAVLGAAAGMLAVVVGTGLGWLATGTFQVAGANWLRLPRASLVVTPFEVGAGVLGGIAVTVVATALASRRALDTGRAAAAFGSSVTTVRRRLVWPPALGLTLTAAALATALWMRGPVPFEWRTFVLVATSAPVMIGLGLCSPIVALAFARVLRSAANRGSRPALRLAAATIAHEPAAPIAVVVGMVVALGAALGVGSLVHSVQKGFLDWIDDHLIADVFVSGAGEFTRMVPQITIPAEVVAAVRAMDGVEHVQTLRAVHTDLDGRAVVLAALGEGKVQRPLHGVAWDEIAAAYRAGEGVVISDTLARTGRLGAGDSLTLRTPQGARAFRVLAVWTDGYGGDTGSVTVHGDRYREIWRDDSVNRLHVTITKGANAEAVRDAIRSRFAVDHSLYALTVEQGRRDVEAMIDDCFAGANAMLTVMVAVAMIGVVNFLLAALLDRRAALDLLRAIGLSTGQMRCAVVFEAGILGMVGVALGLAAGAVAVWGLVHGTVPKLWGWQFEIVLPIGTALVTAVAMVLVAAAAGALPAWAGVRSAPVGGRRLIDR